ncbi:MAG TPA: amino acid permease [Streptosporangiaceae bacterium]
MAMPSTDTDELAKFGYKQELDRSLGLFSSFAAGFSYISIMTGVFELFFFGFFSGGPAFIWTWPAVFAGQFLVALCFAELAGQYPLAGSVYQWSKQIARPFTSFFGGWILSLGRSSRWPRWRSPTRSSRPRSRRRSRSSAARPTSAWSPRRTAPRTPCCWPRAWWCSPP